MSRIEHVQYDAYAVRLPWRAQPLWLLLEPILGAVCGAATGPTVLVLAWGLEDLATTLSVGAFSGAIWGGVTGLVVGLVLTFAAGGHLPPDAARDRAASVASLTTAFVVTVLLLPFFLYPFPYFPVVVATLAAIQAGLLARWLAPRL